MNKTQCRFWHKWNKWENIKDINGYDHIDIKQTRSCKICNKIKGRSVTYVRKVR